MSHSVDDREGLMPASTSSNADGRKEDQPAGMSKDAETSDGRLARGIRAKEAIADALISLLIEGQANPTARDVALRAGVSLRLVFHHFEDMENVFRAAITIQAERYWKGLDPVPPAGDVTTRVKETIQKRADLYEAIGPVRRAAVRRAENSEILSEQMDASRQLLRSHLEVTFARELGDDTVVLDALEVALSFETWDLLRQHMARSVVEASAAVEQLTLGIVCGGR
jgi:TetR/AcrR family transcriptional regulator, regulator of autoinduction and epiphytic fitness